MNIFLFIGLVFIATFWLGKLLEKIHIPWIFAALLIGIFLPTFFSVGIVNSNIFIWLAQLGMYFLLFMIGFELDLLKLKQSSKFIFKSSAVILFLSAVVGAIIIHWWLGYGWFVALVIGASFATVGEAILLPILDSFGITNKSLGQLIIGIGTVDDIIEVLVLVIVSLIAGIGYPGKIYSVLVALFLLFGITAILSKMKQKEVPFRFTNVETLFFIAMSLLFLFIGIGQFAYAEAVAALLAGIALRTFVPNKRLEFIDREIRAVSYGLFAPIFFLWAGASMDIRYLTTEPYLIAGIVFITFIVKLVGSYWLTVKELGWRQSLLLGIGLSVRFSTSIVVTKIMLDSGLIDQRLYSIIIASSIIFTLLIPPIFAGLFYHWRKANVPRFVNN